jgi:hypothetical protein
MGTVKTVTVCDFFSSPLVFVIKFGAGAAASRYGSGSAAKPRLRNTYDMYSFISLKN